MTGRQGMTIREQISAARRAALLRAGIAAEEKEHYSEALARYRRIVEEYPDSVEAEEAKARMQALADIFDRRGQHYRARDIGVP